MFKKLSFILLLSMCVYAEDKQFKGVVDEKVNTVLQYHPIGHFFADDTTEVERTSKTAIYGEKAKVMERLRKEEEIRVAEERKTFKGKLITLWDNTIFNIVVFIKSIFGAIDDLL